ncbi:hypothetical protein [Niastella caeni]|uniref:hypothetical protein n=1 Tax=Niastella caeni TaxID=2569763 RepID=UPI00129B4C57|nr:hypothetical protein [Niastella caeni]
MKILSWTIHVYILNGWRLAEIKLLTYYRFSFARQSFTTVFANWLIWQSKNGGGS